ALPDGRGRPRPRQFAVGRTRDRAHHAALSSQQIPGTAHAAPAGRDQGSDRLVLSDSAAHPRERVRRYATVRRMGSVRKRFPVAAKTAFATAGAIGGKPGSPTPPGASVLGTMCTSITGISDMRSIL